MMSKKAENRDNQQGQIDELDLIKWNEVSTLAGKVDVLARYILKLQKEINKPSETTKRRPTPVNTDKLLDAMNKIPLHNGIKEYTCINNDYANLILGKTYYGFTYYKWYPSTLTNRKKIMILNDSLRSYNLTRFRKK